MIVWMLATLPAGWPLALFKLDRMPNCIVFACVFGIECVHVAWARSVIPLLLLL